jgi:ubiquinone/menaquinone biosynthesis C-methylase UbiE
MQGRVTHAKVADPPVDGLPDYAPQLLAYHAEFATELQAMVAKLPLSSGSKVLEIAAGDGQFAIWLSQRVKPTGTVTAIDISQAWLREAGRNCREQNAEQVQLAQVDATRLPYNDGSFDFVWCGQSLYSLPRLNDCLAEMVRVLRPGGKLAILENDSLHHVLLPWPVDLELQIHAAELKAWQRQTNRPARYYAGRWLSRLMRAAGLKRPRERAFAHLRQQPLSASAQAYFAAYLQATRTRVAADLKPRALRRLDELLDPSSRRCLWQQSDFVAVCIDRLVWAERA